MSTTTKEKRTAAIVPPFGIEIDHPRNNDTMIKHIPGCRLRSAIKSVVVGIDGKINRVLASPEGVSVPNVSGMQLHVNPAKLLYKIIDPLREDKTKCEEILQFMKAHAGYRKTKSVVGVPDQSGTLDVDEMKSLCREMVQLLEGETAVDIKTGKERNMPHAKIVDGPRPDMDDVDELPGDYLLNASTSDFSQTQPRYEKDVSEWKRRLNSLNG